jgi:hypothetical protein
MAAAQDMQAVTGIRFDATLQERMYDESGKALRELKRVGDLGNFHYIDNLARALRFTGMQLIDLIPKIYDTQRVITILREDDSEERVRIDPTLPTPQGKQQTPDGRIERLYIPKLGDYEVAVTIGPSFATKRAEAADSMLSFMQAVPQAGPIIGDLIAKNMDWPGADEISARLASMLPPQLLNKKLEQLPPEARGLVNSMMQQMQQLKQEHDQAVQLLGDKEKDRAIDREELANDRMAIQADIEAKLAKIQEDYETKMAAILAKQGEKDESGSQMVALEKIASDFETKVLKIVADLEAKRMQETSKSVDRQEQGILRRAADREKLEKITTSFDEKMKKMEEKLRDLIKQEPEEEEIHLERDPKTRRVTAMRRGNVSIVFERDPTTQRVAKAKRIRKATIQ